MSQVKQPPDGKQRYPLHITISTLFISLILVMAALLSWQSYRGMSAIMLDSAVDLRERIQNELRLEFKASNDALRGSISQFRLSPVTTARTFSDRVQYLPGMRAMLDSVPTVFAAGIGYADGDYMGLTTANADYIRASVPVPRGARYVLQYINRDRAEPDFDVNRLYYIFYDDSLVELSRTAGTVTDFDARQRPWYRQARAEASATQPYLYYQSRIVGLAVMSESPTPGVVVMLDITLQQLSDNLSQFPLTESSELVLVSESGEVFAYADSMRFSRAAGLTSGESGELAADASPRLPRLAQLGSEVLTSVAGKFDAGERVFDIEHDGRQWLGSTHVIASPGGTGLYALILMPMDELLKGAAALRSQQLLTALLVFVLFVPLVWYLSRRISGPLQVLAQEADAISRFDFERTQQQPSVIKEVDELDQAMEMMKATINRFIVLINSLAGEQDLETLLDQVTDETMHIIDADAMLVYLLDDKEDRYHARVLKTRSGSSLAIDTLPSLQLQQIQSLAGPIGQQPRTVRLSSARPSPLSMLTQLLDSEQIDYVPVALANRNGDVIGLLLYAFTDVPARIAASNIDFVTALSGFAAVTLESRQLIRSQEALLDAFIRLIAGAIDAKSPYTGGHCQRVPEITLMLARAASDSDDRRFADFDLSKEQWEELRLASWLHDCGKVTTPEYVVDKATKLETIYDRIHEIRMRFEVLKRDAQVDCWRRIAEGEDMAESLARLEQEHQGLDDDFAFIAECNVGGEFMSDERIARLGAIAARTWTRTLDDRLGLSWEELERKRDDEQVLPVQEPLVSDKPEHIILRNENELMPEDNPWGFRVDTPEYKYNRGELYNLSIQRGTLTDEERYMINGHMIETIKMLTELPFPRRLRDVPSIAGSHHETMDGKGYPKRLMMEQEPLTARMMVIADIFEALTASDRPYKKAKTLSESLRIMSFMRNDRHIDADLFELFLRSGVYLEYARKFLSAEQIDEVDIESYLQA